jgi:hypothetical protein
MDDLSSRVRPAPRAHADPVHVSASYGHGAHCAECGRIIGRYELEYEVEWQPARIVRMHARCYETRHLKRRPDSKTSH